MITEQEYVLFLVDVVIMSLLGFILGLILDVLFHNPEAEEPLWRSVVMTVAQLFSIAFTIFAVDHIFERLFQHDSDSFVGLTMFIFVFLITQFQIYYRIEKIYHAIVGQDGVIDAVNQ